ncbi:MAG: aminotransferase class I/II-fold pyridoxal phosphate-dependent enzyme [Eubacteriales bacterium]|nr:aminotransferase class I/II-fold pyridoxal phosphate-dependent enzyme [Eubacteriales bacterium]
MNETFADKLRSAMEKQGLKQVDLIREAARQGVKLGKSHMSQYVSGKTVPRADMIHFLAQALQADEDWLSGNSNQEQKQPLPETIESAKTKALGGIKMREFKKSSKLDNVLYDVRGPVVEEATRMEEAGTHVLKLNIGNPAPFGFRTPDEVIYDMRQQLTECEGYSAAKGLFSARKAIMQYAQLKEIPNVSIGDIYTGNGVSELINLCMSALLNDGDEILIPSPDYPLWTACATLAGGKAVHYICDEQSEWYPDMEDIRKKINDRTKAIVIINPNNPTGALYPREVLQQIVEIAREHQLIIFSDEIYDRLVMDGEEHVSIASLAPDLFCVTFSGLSKSHMIAGFRIGWMILSGRKDSAGDYIEGLNMLSNMRLCSNVPAQSIVQTALGGHQSVHDYIIPGGRIYEQRDYIYKALTDIPGISAVKPKAAFYIFPKLDVKRFNIVDDEKFALDLLRDKKILIIHGGGFNWKEPDHFRVVYLPRLEVLDKAARNIGEFLSYYHQ